MTTLVVSGKDAAGVAASAGRGRLDGRRQTAGSTRPGCPPSTITEAGIRCSPRYARATAPRRQPDWRRWPRAIRAGRGRPHPGAAGPGTVFVYSGQGRRRRHGPGDCWPRSPAFAAAVDELEPVFVEQVGFPTRQVIADGDEVRGDARVQPVVMGSQLALTALWRSYGAPRCGDQPLDG